MSLTLKDAWCKVAEWCENPPWELDSDDQQLSLSGNILTLEDGGSVDLSAFLDDTDDQIITGFNLSPAGVLTLTIEDGNTVTADLSGLDTDTDDQTLSLAGTLLTIADGNTVDLAAIDTDDQTLSLDGCDLTISDGNTVDLGPVIPDYPVYRVTGDVNGVNRRVWNAGDGDSVPHDDVDNIFTGPVDPETLFPTHPNTPTVQNIETDWNISTADFGNDGSDQMEVWGWIDTTGLGTVQLRDNNTNTGERGEIWIAVCGGTPVRQPGFNDAVTGNTATDRTLMDPVTVPEGLHFVYGRLSDATAFAGIDIEYDDGSGFSNFPAARSWTTAPVIECLEVSGCDPVPAGYSLCYPGKGVSNSAPETGTGVSQTLTTTTDVVDRASIIQTSFGTSDIHNNGVVPDFSGDVRVDAGWSRASNVFSYAGSPDHVNGVVSLNAADVGASNYWSRPKIRVIKGGQVIAVIDDLVMQQTGAYDGDATVNGSFVDVSPGVNPSYTFEWFDDESRTATLQPESFSSVTLTAVDKVTVLTSAVLV